MTRILLCGGDTSVLEDVRCLLEQAGHHAVLHLLDQGEPGELSSYQLVIVEGSGRSAGQAQALCRLVQLRTAESFLPILFLSEDPAPSARLAGFESGADAYLLRPFDPGELRAQVQALLRIQEMHGRLSDKTAELQRVNRRLHQAYQRIDQELELARRVQQSFLPQALPELPPARFAVHYRPCGRVGGDFYDVFRLDETHVGFYVADAMGHGVPASLLTIFLKRGVRPKDIIGKQYRLVPPDEVLQRLNHDLVSQDLAGEPFITMIYGLFDCRERKLHFARAGHPLPLHLPAGREAQVWQAHGPLLGVFEAEFSPHTQQLHAGDKVLFYTDGIEGLTFADRPAGMESLRACAERHRELPMNEFLPKMSAELTTQGDPQDDVTVLGMEVS